MSSLSLSMFCVRLFGSFSMLSIQLKLKFEMIVAAWGGSVYKRERHTDRQTDRHTVRAGQSTMILPQFAPLSLVRSSLYSPSPSAVAVILLDRRAPHFDMTFSSFIWSCVVCSQLENFYASYGRWWSVIFINGLCLSSSSLHFYGSQQRNARRLEDSWRQANQSNEISILFHKFLIFIFVLRFA